MIIKQRVRNGFYIEFDNGLGISTIWGSGSYSDNHDLSMTAIRDGESVIDAIEKLPLESETVEVMLDGPESAEKYLKYLHRKYDGDGSVIGYLPVEDWLKLIINMSRWSAKGTKEV